MNRMVSYACLGKSVFCALSLLPVFRGGCGETLVVWAAGLTIVCNAMRIILTRKCCSVVCCDMCSVLCAELEFYFKIRGQNKLSSSVVAWEVGKYDKMHCLGLIW